MKILFLSHRVPYPPNKGDKIRSFHEIRHFSKNHEIDLLAFCHNPDELEFDKPLKKYCSDVTLIPLNCRLQRILSILSMLRRKPLTEGYFSHPQMWGEVRNRLNTFQYDAIFVYSSSMAPYAANINGIPKFLDFVDSDASKWLQYAEYKAVPMSWLYRYEGKKMAEFEREMVRAYDASIFVSARETRHLLDNNYRDKIHFVQNGIDIKYFSESRPEKSSDILIFTGAMDYYPNIDAVTFFTNDIFPLVRSVRPTAQFLIVGSQPTPAVRKLGNRDGITVTGTVPDVRPYMEKAKVSVIPMRISQGIQNKILEAVAAGIPVVTTSAAAAGFNATGKMPITIADSAADIAENIIRLLGESLSADRVAACRNYLDNNFNWDKNLLAFDGIFNQAVSSGSKATH
ncbi:MAG: TIGR03087 family PEP-CTERM/XrtA system glycosyltransferase [Acidobacteriota bacterium]